LHPLGAAADSSRIRQQYRYLRSRVDHTDMNYIYTHKAQSDIIMYRRISGNMIGSMDISHWSQLELIRCPIPLLYLSVHASDLDRILNSGSDSQLTTTLLQLRTLSRSNSWVILSSKLKILIAFSLHWPVFNQASYRTTKVRRRTLAHFGSGLLW